MVLTVQQQKKKIRLPFLPQNFATMGHLLFRTESELD